MIKLIKVNATDKFSDTRFDAKARFINPNEISAVWEEFTFDCEMTCLCVNGVGKLYIYKPIEEVFLTFGIDIEDKLEIIL